MRWSTTLATWTRREAVLVAELAIAAGAAALAGPSHAPWLVRPSAAVGAVARGVIAVARARLEGRVERAEWMRRLRVPVAPVGDVDPTLVGVDPTAQAILAGGPVPAYVGREVDAVAREAVAAGWRGAGPWLVAVVGPPTPGSRGRCSRRCAGVLRTAGCRWSRQPTVRRCTGCWCQAKTCG